MKKYLKNDPLPTALVHGMTTKLDCRIQFFGCVDELSSHLMKVRSLIDDDEELREDIVKIVKTLSSVMGEVAGCDFKLGETQLVELLEMVKKYQVNNGILKEFILPGQNTKSADIHIARCVARRAELCYAHVYSEYQGNEYIFEYLNKISTFLFAVAQRYE